MMPLSSCTEVEKLIKTDPIEDYYEIGAELGRGKFAVVKKCTDKRTGCVYAAKFLRKRRRAVSCREEIITEIDIMRQAVSHPGVIQLQEVYESQREIIIILEIAKGGELFRLISQDPLSEEQAREVTFQILDAVSHLHDHGIIHLDLKPENVLLAEPEELVIRVADFGLAVQLRPGQQCRNLVGTPEYVAPEILNYEPLSCASDMWSIGAMTYALLTGYSPFQGEEELETFLNVSKVTYDFEDEIFENVSDEAKDFISRLLKKDASKRMTAKKCLEHSWLTKAKGAATRAITKSKGKKKNDSCCESLSSNDSPYDISQDSTSSLDVSPLSSASSSFSPAAGKPSDDETLSTTPVKLMQSSLDEKVSEKNDNSDMDNDSVTKRSLTETIRNTIKGRDGGSVKKSSPISTPTGSFGSSRSVKTSTVSTRTLPSTSPSVDGSGVLKSTSDSTMTSSDTTDSVSIPQSQSATNTNSANVNINNVDTSQVVMRRKSRAKVSTDGTNKNEEVKRRNKVNPESLPNYSRDSYRRNSMNFSESTQSSDVDVMEFLRSGSLPGSTSADAVWPPPAQSPRSTNTSHSSSTLHPITESNSKSRVCYRDKSPKISFDAQIALLEQAEKLEQAENSEKDKKPEGTTAEVCPCPPSPKIAMEAIQELQSELKVGIGWTEKTRRSSDEGQKRASPEEPKKTSPTTASQPRSKRASSPKISMEAILDILQNPECEIKIESEDTHHRLTRKLSQPKDEQMLKPKNSERTTEWKTLPRRHSTKPSYIVQSKPIKMDNAKPSYNPTGPFQFLPNPNSRLVDRRGSLPVNAVGGKSYGSSSSTQLPSSPLNGSQYSSASKERSMTPLSFYTNPSSRSNSPLHYSPFYSSSTVTLSPSSTKISHWKSCEDLDN